MVDRMDLLATRPYQKDGETRTAFTKIGVAFATKNGGWSLSFEALPLPSLNDKGGIETRVLMMPPKPRDEANAHSPGGPSGASHDDDIPFGPDR